MTTANREQRRAAAKGGTRQIIKAIEAAPPFEPYSIGTVNVNDLRQLKLRATTIERLERELQETNYELQLLRVESVTFATNVGNRYGCPPGGRVQIDSETGDILLVELPPKAEPAPEEPAVAQAEAEDSAAQDEPPLEE